MRFSLIMLPLQYYIKKNTYHNNNNNSNNNININRFENSNELYKKNILKLR